MKPGYRHGLIAIALAALTLFACSDGTPEASSDYPDLTIEEIRSSVEERAPEFAASLADLGLREAFSYAAHNQCTGDNVDSPRGDRTWTYEASIGFDVTEASPPSLQEIEGLVDALEEEAAALGWGDFDKNPMTHLGDGGFASFDEYLTLTVRTATSSSGADFGPAVVTRVAVVVDGECIPMSDTDHDRYERDDLGHARPLDLSG